MAEASLATEPSEPRGKWAQLPDKDFYSWTTLFSLMIGRGTLEDRRRYVNIRNVENMEHNNTRCEKWRDQVLENSPVVRFLMDEIAKVGPEIPRSAIRCRFCESQKLTGGFSPERGILLCSNHLDRRSRVEDTLAHELVHAYDHVRWQLDPVDDLRHAACMEIRASALSGECRFMNEVIGKKQWKLAGQFQECVRRRAVLSVMARPKARGDEEKAKRVVDAVWESCFNDTRPFDEIYR